MQAKYEVTLRSVMEEFFISLDLFIDLLIFIELKDIGLEEQKN